VNIPTIYDVLVALEPSIADKVNVTGEDFARYALPFFGGCFGCGASLSAHNACMGRNGLLVGTCCSDVHNAFATIPECLRHHAEFCSDRAEESAEMAAVQIAAAQEIMRELFAARDDLNSLSHDRAGVWTRPENPNWASAFDDAWQRFTDALTALEGKR